jgi:hypothetical protein
MQRELDVARRELLVQVKQLNALSPASQVEESMGMLSALRWFDPTGHHLDEAEDSLNKLVYGDPRHPKVGRRPATHRLIGGTMTVTATFFEHENFGGSSNSFTTERRAIVACISRARQRSHCDARHCGGRQGRQCLRIHESEFRRSLCQPEHGGSWTCWYSNVGPLNDDIESVLLVNRDKEEANLDAGFWLATPSLPSWTKCSPASRSGGMAIP